MTTTTEHLKRLAEEATPGPWVADDGDGSPMGNSGWMVGESKTGGAIANLFDAAGPRVVDCDNAQANAAFIAAANPATIKALCELVEQMFDRLLDVVGCFDAACYEGLSDRLTEQSQDVGSLADLVQRRLSPAYTSAAEALAAYEAFQKGEGK